MSEAGKDSDNIEASVAQVSSFETHGRYVVPPRQNTSQRPRMNQSSNPNSTEIHRHSFNFASDGSRDPNLTGRKLANLTTS